TPKGPVAFELSGRPRPSGVSVNIKLHDLPDGSTLTEAVTVVTDDAPGLHMSADDQAPAHTNDETLARISGYLRSSLPGFGNSLSNDDDNDGNKEREKDADVWSS